MSRSSGKAGRRDGPALARSIIRTARSIARLSRAATMLGLAASNAAGACQSISRWARHIQADADKKGAKMPRVKIIDTWNHPRGFRPRGPFDLPGTGPRPPRLARLGVRSIIGRRVLDSAQLGSYGMGGPGFVGLELSAGTIDGRRRPREWLVLTLWGAADRLTIDDEPLPPCTGAITAGCTAGWLPQLAGQRVDAVDWRRDWLNMAIGEHVIEMRPGQLPRGKSALDAWVLSRSKWLIV